MRVPEQEQILKEQVKQLYSLAPLGLIATVMNSILVFLIMRDVVPATWLVLWFGFVLAVTALRCCLVACFRRAHLERPGAAATWSGRFVTGLALVGAAWGSIALIPFDFSLAHQVFLAFVLGGLAAGASSTFSKVPYGFLSFSVPALIPLALHFLVIGDSFHNVMAAMTLLFLVLLWSIGQHNYSVNRTSLLLRFENREVISSLERAKNDMEGLYLQLREENEAKRKVEAELREYQQHLEQTVAQRTRDLTAANEDLKEFQEKLTAAKEAAEAGNQAKSEFLANMSHEMRTPLAGTLGMIRLVLDMGIGAEERKLLEMARRSAESLLRILGDVLDFSRLEAGVLEFEVGPFPVAEAIRTAVEVVSISALEKGLKVEWSVDESVKEVEGDVGRVRQVLVNLLGNAIKFTPTGGVEVAARPFCDLGARGKDCVLFSVRDTGAGIPTDQLERIFSKFTQVDSSLTRRHGGTGLGLTLSREIVERSGGRIWVESRVGAGSTFYFTLPMRRGG